ncbi:MAG: pantetheine-phosphate adenylyltransferase [Actinomycetota bacterium]
MTLAICPGSFDPPTNGHIDVVQRACRHFETVLVAVLDNPAKKTLFPASERVELLRKALAGCPNARVEAYRGLLVDLARARGAQMVVKGLRALSDVEYELQMAQINAKLLDGLDTAFIATNPRWSFISSSLVKEVASYGGDVSELVPAGVEEALKQRFRAE